jgi:hypothetical protein
LKEIEVTKPINNLGMKKYLVFILGKGTETNWVMEEYHISSYESRRGQNQVNNYGEKKY